MSVKDYKKIITVQNGITGDIEQVDFDIAGMGLFNLKIKDYLLLQKIKNCIDNNVECFVNIGFKK